MVVRCQSLVHWNNGFGWRFKILQGILQFHFLCQFCNCGNGTNFFAFATSSGGFFTAVVIVGILVILMLTFLMLHLSQNLHMQHLLLLQAKQSGLQNSQFLH